MIWTKDRPSRPLWILCAIGMASAILYEIGRVMLPFRGGRIDVFLLVYGAVFAQYVGAVWVVLKSPPMGNKGLLVVFGYAVLFNMLLLPTIPNLSNDMFRYVWDGRVQANGINPYRYASDAPELRDLRDLQIWARMNRLDAHTLYPPGALMVFAAWWQVVGDSILGFKALFVGCSFLGAALLVQLLKRLGEAPERVLIFLWNPLLVFEIAHAGHLDALYLPLVVGALLLRAARPREQLDWRNEAGIGVLIGLAILTKLYPAILLPPLWSVRDSGGRRRWRLALPVAALLVTGLGYAVYIAPGVDTLGFLPRYVLEFFNVGPLPLTLVYWSEGNHWPWYAATAMLTPILLILISLYFVLFPARTPRQAIRRCIYPVAIYFLMSYNLFSWYALWLLPFISLELKPGRVGFCLNQALGWLLFTGLVVLSYTVFGTGFPDPAIINVEFYPVYILLLVALVPALRRCLNPLLRGKSA